MKKSTAILRFIIVEVIYITIIVLLMNALASVFGHFYLQICIKGNESYYERTGWTEESTRLYNLEIATQEKFMENRPLLKWIEKTFNNVLEVSLIISIAIMLLLYRFFISMQKFIKNFIHTYKKRYSKI